MSIIKELVIIFTASVIIIFIFRKMKLPGITGFLIAGIIIGPYGFKLISEENIEVMAELGVILLLFTIGIEISFSELLKIKKLLLYAGGLQVSATVLISSVLFLTAGFGFEQSIFLAMLISLSSTAVVFRLLKDNNEINTPQGKINSGILIFQDLAIVPMMLILPLLGSKGEVSPLTFFLRMFLDLAILTALVLTARYFVPKLLGIIAKLKVREIFTIGIILLILSTAYLTELIGLSLAIGAFIAGLIISETDFSHQAVAEIIPLKDAFNSLFFVSVGMLLNYKFVTEFPLILVLVTLGIIILKASIIFIIVYTLKYPPRIALISAFSLVQIGEFSFVLAISGMQYTLISPELYNAFIASSIFTIIATPLLYKIAPSMAGKLNSGPARFNESESKEGMKLKDHVVIAGFGINGRNIVRVLRETGIPYIVVELNPDTVNEYKKKKEKIVYGDITRRDMLHELRVESANVLVLAISDLRSTKMAISISKEMNPDIHLIVRTRFISEVDDLINLGADEVIPEEFETSLQIFGKVLQKYHIPLNVIMKQMNIIRNESYEVLRSESGDVHPLSNIDKILAEGLTESYFVEDENKNAGKNLAQLNLRALTGATVIAILRAGKTSPNPSGEEKLEAGDTLVLYGTHLAVDKAINLLNK